jgi:hypothetical protein
MSSSETRELLTRQIENFIDEMCQVFPDSRSLQIYRQQFEILKSLSSRVIVEGFSTYVLPHKDKIMNEEEDFFKNGGGQDFVKGDMVKFRDTMSDIWNERLSEGNKKVCWKYFKVFVLLCERYKHQIENGL